MPAGAPQQHPWRLARGGPGRQLELATGAGTPHRPAQVIGQDLPRHGTFQRIQRGVPGSDVRTEDHDVVAAPHRIPEVPRDREVRDLPAAPVLYRQLPGLSVASEPQENRVAERQLQYGALHPRGIDEGEVPHLALHQVPLCPGVVPRHRRKREHTPHPTPRIPVSHRPDRTHPQQHPVPRDQ